MREHHVIGKHLVITDGDVVYVHWDGVTSLDEIKTVQGIYEARLRVHPRLFSVFHVARAVPPTPEVRRRMAQWRREHKVAASVVIGASRPLRAIATLYLRAAQLLGLRTWPVAFVEDDAAAQAFLAERRRHDGG